MTFPTVIETPLPLEPVTRDPFADAPRIGVENPGSASAQSADDAGQRAA